MIKASDLRKGNWVNYDEDSTPFMVKEIGSTGLGVENEEESTWIELDQFSPIPLTPKVLVMCGFKGLPHFTVQNSMQLSVGRNRFISVGCVGTPNEMVFLTEEEKPKVNAVIVLRNFDYDGKTYLHQLQNLYYSLTGEEIEMRLLRASQ